MDAIELLSGLKSPSVVDTLEGALRSTESEDAFRSNWFEFFSQDKAKNISSIVYVWAAQRLVSRLKDESNIIYIGKTDATLLRRHRRYKTNGMSGNWETDHHIFKKYGSVKVHFVKCANPKKAETELLEAYYRYHRELPPLNNIRFA